MTGGTRNYLHLCCGDYQLLLDVQYVVEVADRPGDVTERKHDNAEHRLWRGRTLPRVDLARFLQTTASDALHQLVLGEQNAQSQWLVLDVDQATDLLEINDDAFVQMAQVSNQLQRWVDGVFYSDSDQRCFMRVNPAGLRDVLADQSGKEQAR